MTQNDLMQVRMNDADRMRASLADRVLAAAAGTFGFPAARPVGKPSLGTVCRRDPATKRPVYALLDPQDPTRPVEMLPFNDFVVDAVKTNANMRYAPVTVFLHPGMRAFARSLTVMDLFEAEMLFRTERYDDAPDALVVVQADTDGDGFHALTTSGFVPYGPRAFVLAL